MKIAKWSVIKTFIGLSLKPDGEFNAYEVCVSVSPIHGLTVTVHEDGVDRPVSTSIITLK